MTRPKIKSQKICRTDDLINHDSISKINKYKIKKYKKILYICKKIIYSDASYTTFTDREHFFSVYNFKKLKKMAMAMGIGLTNSESYTYDNRFLLLDFVEMRIKINNIKRILKEN